MTPEGSDHITARADDMIAGYDDTAVLGPLQLRLHPGITALLGRNGSGKTTLMRTLCGIIPPLSGRCIVLGEQVVDGAAVRSRVGYLGHKSALSSGLSVAQNLSFWRTINASLPQIPLIAEAELIGRFDLEPILDKRVSALSRGQRQRVDLARLAMTDPEFVVLDEPLTGLDPVYAAETRALLHEWGTTRTVLYSTHSVAEALELASRFLIVDGRDVLTLGSDGTAITETQILQSLGASS
ncbi:ABC transporter ATP-binding protein [Corynebacteriaceae bacterium 6-324]